MLVSNNECFLLPYQTHFQLGSHSLHRIQYLVYRVQMVAHPGSAAVDGSADHLDQVAVVLEAMVLLVLVRVVVVVAFSAFRSLVGLAVDSTVRVVDFVVVVGVVAVPVNLGALADSVDLDSCRDCLVDLVALEEEFQYWVSVDQTHQPSHQL